MTARSMAPLPPLLQVIVDCLAANDRRSQDRVLAAHGGCLPAASGQSAGPVVHVPLTTEPFLEIKKLTAC